ncbi:nitroreductase family protein [Propionivibrio soli]|uniref:nitroreductase family protein n=1 Tax=Propionivibrio soli TaxID=2976531 RepID=UPI0021E84A29|nr:SagB/ThcOx family dehydrogenase [Propionivibrio soli]
MDSKQEYLPLPSPQMFGGKPLMEVLRDRESRREFSAEPLSDQILADLLWAAIGVNRPESGKLTVPNGRSRREIDVYLITAEAVYRYDIDGHVLVTTKRGDLRHLAGKQDFVATAPVNLVFVADLNKMPDLTLEQQLIYSAIDAGFCVQNVYLYCTSIGLATVARGSIDRQALGVALDFDKHHRIVLAQSVGYPA